MENKYNAATVTIQQLNHHQLQLQNTHESVINQLELKNSALHSDVIQAHEMIYRHNQRILELETKIVQLTNSNNSLTANAKAQADSLPTSTNPSNTAITDMNEQVQANNKLQLELQVLRARIQQLEAQQGIVVQERNDALEKVQEVCNCFGAFVYRYIFRICVL